ncbi:hypothetical protein LX36DRAFT_654353 [Colletotrichum falcatum]|nr:hypothetical protein LX36DRAFT_654353 [Colletotrichum falcatum]
MASLFYYLGVPSLVLLHLDLEAPELNLAGLSALLCSSLGITQRPSVYLIHPSNDGQPAQAGQVCRTQYKTSLPSRCMCQAACLSARRPSQSADSFEARSKSLLSLT